MQWSTEKEKQLALLQETEGLQWFSTQTGDRESVRIWEGDKEEYEGEWEEYCKEIEKANSESDVDENALDFEVWLAENYEDKEVDVEDYDESGDWKVFTDEEADEAWDESLESYIDECILPDLDERYHMYFDREKWKGDAQIDGRGHSLSGYDGNECEQEVNGTTYYLYRQN